MLSHLLTWNKYSTVNQLNFNLKKSKYLWVAEQGAELIFVMCAINAL